VTGPAERIDAHHHLWDLAARPQPWTAGLPPLSRSFTVTDLLPRMEAADVGGSVVVHTVHELDETYELLEVAAGEPRIVGVVGWFDVTDPDVGDELAQARAARGGEFLVSVRHQAEAEPDRTWLERDDVRRGIAAVGAAGLAWDFVVSSGQLPQVVSVVDALPDVRFVLDHCGKPPIAAGGAGLDAWRHDLADLARRPNVAVKVSGLVTEADREHWTAADLAPVADHALEVFGPDRVMFGTDWPVSLVAGADYSRVVETAAALFGGLGADESAAVWAGTARRWYGLAQP
jgi:L-fuconolactonase